METLITPDLSLLTTLGRNLRMYRLRLKLTQTALADKTGLARANISRIENNFKAKKPYNPSLLFVASLATGLGVKFLDLFKE